jgi:hypothetical protein
MKNRNNPAKAAQRSNCLTNAIDNTTQAKSET